MTYRSPAAAIDRLIKEGFFKNGKTDIDVINELKIKGFRHSRGSIATTLLRFARREALQREKSNGAYKYLSMN